MGKYQAYPEYKDSGVAWPNKIPDGWKTNKVRYLFSFDKGLTITKENLQDDGIPCVNYGEVHSRFGFEVDPERDALKCVDENYLVASSKSLLKEGDLVFADTSEDIEGSGNFTQLVNDVPVFAGYHTIILRPFDRDAYRFYAYLFDCSEFRTQTRLAVKGVKVFSITQAILRGLDVWIPPLDERKKIAAFLDHETAKIDALIEKQQQLIQLLKEKRQAVISHAVTKGLNPNAPMKDSGIEWLGEVPAHWSLSEIRYVTSQIGGGTPSKDRVDFWNGNIPWVSPKDMKVDYIQTAQDKITPQAIRESSAKLVPEGCVLIVVRGMILAHSVPVALTLKSLTINQDMKALVPSKKVDGEFLLFLIKGLSNLILNQVEESAHGTKCLRTDVFERMKICIPDVNEQCVIVTQLKDRLEAIDLMLGRAAASMELLIERRTALISAAVTGKIDVRHFSEPATR